MQGTVLPVPLPPSSSLFPPPTHPITTNNTNNTDVHHQQHDVIHVQREEEKPNINTPDSPSPLDRHMSIPDPPVELYRLPSDGMESINGNEEEERRHDDEDEDDDVSRSSSPSSQSMYPYATYVQQRGLNIPSSTPPIDTNALNNNNNNGGGGTEVAISAADFHDEQIHLQNGYVYQKKFG